MVDACLAGPIAKTAFEQGGDGEAIIIGELGEEVVLGVEPSKRGLWGTDITKVAILVPATSESLAVKTISILSAHTSFEWPRRIAEIAHRCIKYKSKGSIQLRISAYLYSIQMLKLPLRICLY